VQGDVGTAVQPQGDPGFLEADEAAQVGMQRLVDGLLQSEAQQDGDPATLAGQPVHELELFGSQDLAGDGRTGRRQVLQIHAQRTVHFAGSQSHREAPLV